MITKSNFFNLAKEKFPKFDYSKSIYTKSCEPITIICPEHGEFITKPGVFMRSKHGCPKCAKEAGTDSRRKSPEKFIEECKTIWGNKYTYEKTKYVNSETKVIVTCPVHGDFKIRPSDFLRKHGCPKCKGDKTAIINKKIHGYTLEVFINKSKLLYDNLFDYSKVIYINSNIKVCIHSNILDEDFLITPKNFLKGRVPKKYLGLPKCHQDTLNTEIFIQRAKLLYGNKYDYSKVEYVNNNTKVCIICPEHGEFWQTPINHLDNFEGCPRCAQSRGETAVSMYLDFLKYEYCQQYKININEKIYKIDFCTIVNNQVVFIEYNGRQHYEPVEFFGGEPQFIKQQNRDNIVRNYCKENNIVLLEYTYKTPLQDLLNLIRKDLNEIKNRT